MRKIAILGAMGLILAFLMAGCAKPPQQQMDAAKAAVEACKSEGADVYAADEFKKLNDDLQAALDQVTAKKYKQAKEMLIKVAADADALKATIPAKKEEAKKAAVAAQGEARTALDEAKALLEKAPKGKGTKADIEAFTADLKGLEDSFPEVQAAIDKGDFFGAKDKAVAIKDKAASISEQIKQAIEKVQKKK
ncbi:MAG: hypothetical protein ACUVWQ_02860 [Candidatus Aminicenantales bacterium]